jgi:type II secretory pathway component PulJ
VRRKHLQPFTLLEVVLAVTIFAFIAMTVGTAFFGLHRTWAKTQKRSADLQVLQRIERVADTAFRNMIPFKWFDDNQKERFVFVGNPDQLTFAYLHRINVVEAGAIRFLTVKLDGDKLVAEYRDSPILPWRSDSTAIRREVLAEKVKSLSFSYADRHKPPMRRPRYHRR